MWTLNAKTLSLTGRWVSPAQRVLEYHHQSESDWWPSLWSGMQVSQLSPLIINGYSLLPGSPQFSMELIAEATQNMTTSRESFKKLKSRDLLTPWQRMCLFGGKSVGLAVFAFFPQVFGAKQRSPSSCNRRGEKVLVERLSSLPSQSTEEKVNSAPRHSTVHY